MKGQKSVQQKRRFLWILLVNLCFICKWLHSWVTCWILPRIVINLAQKVSKLNVYGYGSCCILVLHRRLAICYKNLCLIRKPNGQRTAWRYQNNKFSPSILNLFSYKNNTNKSSAIQRNACTSRHTARGHFETTTTSKQCSLLYQNTNANKTNVRGSLFLVVLLKKKEGKIESERVEWGIYSMQDRSEKCL